MRAILQRVSDARVRVDGEVVGQIEAGLLALVGVTHTDTVADAQWIARKIADLRILREEASAADAGAEVLVVSQFTLYGKARKGRRPSWTEAAPGPVAEPLVDAVAEELCFCGIQVGTGRFGAEMAVEMTGDGPVTLILDSP